MLTHTHSPYLAPTFWPSHQKTKNIFLSPLVSTLRLNKFLNVYLLHSEGLISADAAKLNVMQDARWVPGGQLSVKMIWINFCLKLSFCQRQSFKTQDVFKTFIFQRRYEKITFKFIFTQHSDATYLKNFYKIVVIFQWFFTVTLIEGQNLLFSWERMDCQFLAQGEKCLV